MSARNRELFGLLPVSLLVTAGFTAVLITRSRDINKVTITYGAIFLGACVFGHIFIRARLPDADPYLFPLCALLAAFGLVAPQGHRAGRRRGLGALAVGLLRRQRHRALLARVA